MKNHLPPEKFGKAAVVKHGAYTFEKLAIEGFCNPIVLGGIMCGESAFHALGFEVIGELCAEVLASAVTAETFDLCAMLGVSPSFEFDIGIEGVILPMKKFDMRPAGTVIGERGVIFPITPPPHQPQPIHHHLSPQPPPHLPPLPYLPVLHPSSLSALSFHSSALCPTICLEVTFLLAVVACHVLPPPGASTELPPSPLRPVRIKCNVLLIPPGVLLHEVTSVKIIGYETDYSVRIKWGFAQLCSGKDRRYGGFINGWE